MSKGIDYGNGTTNCDHATGIRFGVINQNEVCQAWCDSAEAEYPEWDESYCECEQDEDGEVIGECNCEESFNENSEPIAWNYEGDGYKCTQTSDDGDIFILKSPYYTRAQFCSPCAPGACYLMNPCDDGEKAYCFGHDWFWDTDEKCAPYPVWRVSDGTLVEPDAK